MTTTAAYPCRVCGQRKPYEEMTHHRGQVRRICRTCNVKQNQEWRARGNEARAARHAEEREQKQQSKLDPCPACGVPQALHWKCRICTARGHILRRSTNDPTICADCESNIKAGRLSTAA